MDRRFVINTFVLPALLGMTVFAGVLYHHDASPVWALTFPVFLAIVQWAGWHLSERVKTPVARKRAYVTLVTMGWAGFMLLADLLTDFRVLSLGGVAIGTLVFGAAMWATYSGDPLQRFAPRAGMRSHPPRPSEIVHKPGQPE